MAELTNVELNNVSGGSCYCFTIHKRSNPSAKLHGLSTKSKPNILSKQTCENKCCPITEPNSQIINKGYFWQTATFPC